eukprot:533471_1
MACQCSTLLPEQIIEAFNDVAKAWQICSISSIQTNQPTHHHIENGAGHSTRHCNTMLTLSVMNTTNTIQSISCTDFKTKWRFLSPSKLAHPPPKQTVQIPTLKPHPIIDDVSSASDSDDDHHLPIIHTNHKRKRKFAELTVTEFAHNDHNKETHTNTDNTPHSLLLPDITLLDTPPKTNDDTANSATRVAKRRRLSASTDTFNRSATPKSFLTMTRAKKKKKKHPTPPIIVPQASNNNNTNNSSHNHDAKAQRLMRLAALMPTNCENLMYTRALSKEEPPPMIPTKPPTPIKTRVKGDDETRFDALDQFRLKNEDKFPSLATIERLCGMRRHDTKKLALRYFKCRDSDRDYILMETNEYRCTKCHQMYNNDGLGVDSLTKIKTHVILHTDDAFKCPVCSKPFVNEHHLLYHIRQKKDAKNAHKQYYVKHYADSQCAMKAKRVRKKTIRNKESKESMVMKTQTNTGYYKRPSYHDGPPPLSPVPDEDDEEEMAKQESDVLLSPLQLSRKTNANDTSNNMADVAVKYTCPASPYDVAPLPISTTAPGEEMSLSILDAETTETETKFEYPPVPLAPN